MRQKLIALAGKIVFRIAFAGLIFLQFVFVVLLLWGFSEIFSSDNYFEVGVLAALVLLSPFLIGANSYFLFQRFTRVQYVLAESERWLTERRHPNRLWIRRRKILKRWTAWTPTASVVILCVFMDYTWAFSSHLFHAGSGKLMEYEVSIPFTWAIAYSDI